MNQSYSPRKTFYTAFTMGRQSPATRTVLIYASEIKYAHAAARAYFGTGISFSTRESTHDETLHADPHDVIKTK